MNSLQDFQTTNKLDHELILSSLPPTPSKSTAFTIEFDDLNNNQLKNNRQNKKFERNSLRESLRKNAPEKLEKLTKLKDRTEDIKNVDTCKNLNYSTSLNQDRNLSDGASFLIQKMFSSDKLTKSNLTKSDTKSNRLSNKTNLKDYYSDTASRSCKSSPLKLSNYNNFNNFNKSSNFNSTNTDSGVNSSVCADDLENQSINKLNGYLKTDDDDNLSETGTYTVELDNQDPITEEARKRINDIFGLRETKYKIDDLKLNLDTASTTSTSSSKPNSKHSFKISTIKPIYQKNSRSRHNSEKNLSTPKLNIKKENTIDNELQRKNSIKSINSSERLSFRNRKSSVQNSNFKRQDSFSKSSVNNKSINTTTTTTTNKKSQNFNLINQNNTFVFNCNNGSPLLNRARANSISRCLTKDTSTNIKVNNKKTRQNKLNDETNSIKSEEVNSNGSGTDLSSINSDKCKSDNGQISSLRFNRAFALRRARLGIDTPPIINNKKNSNKPNSHIPTQIFANNSRSSSQCSATTTATYDHHRPIFDRSDGGRFSLRENSKSSIKPPINRQTKLINNNKIVRQESSSSLINAIKTTKTNMVNKIIKNTSTTITKTSTTKNTTTKNLNKETTISNHVRANSFGGSNIGNNTFSSLNNNETIVLNNLNQLKQTSNLLSSAASTSSNNTLSNASTSEDLSNISDQLNNVKQLQNLSPFQLGRRIYSTKPHYIAQTNSLRTKLEENSNFIYQNGSFTDLNNQTTNQLNELPTSSLTSTKIETSKKKFGQLSSIDSQTNNDFNNQNNSSNIKVLSALDYLVLGAVNQLSFKLRCKLRLILDTEKNKYPIDNDRRIIIEELLPQVNISEYRNSDSVSDKTISRDLSNVLKNLKRIEQSLEVINLLLESNNLNDEKEDDKLCNKDAILTNDDNFSLEI